MSKKRKREYDETSLALVEVYNNLADENESTRLKAAQSLLEKFSDPARCNPHQISTALTRLIRGLCSSRKAARIGFSIALTEFLSQVFSFTDAQRGIDKEQAVKVLEAQTSPAESVSRQDERDHHLGRLFGAEAFIKSSIFLESSASEPLSHVLDLVCELAIKKPWLRQECGWVLYSCLLTLPPSTKWVAESILVSLLSHNLCQTPEGVAAWLAVKQRFSDVKFPLDVWKHDNPLYKKDKSLLAKAMRDATPKHEDDDNAKHAQGGAVWKAQLHFAWETVLGSLYSNTDESGQLRDPKLISFEHFWTEAVDESLFAASSSSERKHTGFLVCHVALSSAPSPLLPTILKGNVMRTLINQLASGDRLLHRAAQRMIQGILVRASESPAAVNVLFTALLTGTEGSAGFDQVTKTKTLEKLITIADLESLDGIARTLTSNMAQAGVADVKQAQARRQTTADLLVLLYGRSLAEEPMSKKSVRLREHVLKTFVCFAYFSPSSGSERAVNQSLVTASTRSMAQTRLLSCLERAMKVSDSEDTPLDTTLAEIRRLQKKSKSWKLVVNFDEEVRSIVELGWTALESSQKSQSANAGKALRLLLQLSILQVYNGEVEAVQILEELVDYVQDLDQRGQDDSADSFVEILLSFSSKPSKFLRRIILQVFQGFAPSMTADGLRPLLRVLEAPESVKGQQELFDTQPSDEEDEEEDSVGDSDTSSRLLDSDVEMLDSDVEEVSQNADSMSEDDDAEDGDEAHVNGREQEEDEELAAFDAKLATALGTRKGEDDLEASDTSGSDDDMDDDQMAALDEQLATVFRARKDMVNKTKDNKDARGNIVQFKNRVLDLLEAYLKQEYLNPLALTLILPLLNTARQTRTKQVSDRACQILREFCSRCKGKNVPAETNVSVVTGLLNLVHAEVCFQSSQSHATACSQSSILLVKVLVSVDPATVSMAVDAYGDLRKKQLTDKQCHVQPAFFTDWNNWCANASQQLRKVTSQF